MTSLDHLYYSLWLNRTELNTECRELEAQVNLRRDLKDQEGKKKDH